MANTPRRITQSVEVELLQDDMKGFEQNLPYNMRNLYLLENLYGKSLFTEKIIWGEVWLKDISRRGTIFQGYVYDGKLYIERSGRKGVFHNRKNSNKKPSKLPIGNYKIWLDAWVYRKKYNEIYKQDVLFTTYGKFGEDRKNNWRAPRAMPSVRYWQKIQINPPPKNKGVSQVYVKSCRYHYIYRLSRLLDTLERLILPQESLIAEVANLRDYLVYLITILDAALLRNPIQINDPNWISMRKNILYEEITKCDIFIESGVGIAFHPDQYKDVSSWLPMRDRQHINNIAHLVWKLINNPDFAEHIMRFGKKGFGDLAEEHSIIISRVPIVLNKIPGTCGAVEKKRGTFYRKKISIPYGRWFAEKITLPFFNKVIKESGGKLPFPRQKHGNENMAATMNSMRKYSLAALEAATLYITHVRNTKDLIALSYELSRLNEAMPIAKGVLYKGVYANDWFMDFNKVYEELEDSWARLKQPKLAEAIREMKWGDIQTAAAGNKVNIDEIKIRIDNVQSKIEAIEQPVGFKKGLEMSAPKAVYTLHTFDTVLRWLIVHDAWNQYVESADDGKAEGHTSTEYKFMNAIVKTIKAEASLMKNVGIARLLEKTPMSDEAIEKLVGWGKGLNAVADISEASLYTYKVFYSETFQDDLLDRYTPGSATAMYGFHLVVWAGKWLEAIGDAGDSKSISGISVGKGRTAGGLLGRLKILGDLLQLVGTAGNEFMKVGRDLEKPFIDTWRIKVRLQNNILKSRLEKMKYHGEFLDDLQIEEFIRCSKEYSWMKFGPTRDEYVRFFPM